MTEAMSRAIVVTGGAGFIGSNFILQWLTSQGSQVMNLDKLTYAGNPANLAAAAGDPRYAFVRGDINDVPLVRELLARHRPAAVVHFAAESHVDRSIHDAEDFIRTNIQGTFHLLQATREYWDSLSAADREAFRFLHVSTDEVYGSLGLADPPFRETAAYAPNSPYAASKAAADHLVRAFHQTYSLPTLTTNCSNNYGPYQFPEKLIPLTIHNATRGEPLPVYGDGLHVRDWLYVGDHCEAIRQVLAHGRAGRTYNIGGNSEKSNIEVVKEICAILEELRPGPRYESLITYVKDRPGHDRRYAMDSTKIQKELGWTPQESFSGGLRKTVEWYLANDEWVSSITTGAYREWIERHYHNGSRGQGNHE
jgi:dTDP-glucose 4,6-dehydratase